MTPLLALLLACAPTPDAPYGLTPDERAPTELAAAPEGVAPTDLAAPTAAHDGAVEAPSRRGSLYALDAPLLTDDGATRALDVARGHPTILSMFYTTCPMACPLLIQDIQGLEATLTPEERAGLRVVLVSLDPDNDDAAAMTGIVGRHHLDDRWTLGAVPPDAVRDVAAALGVRYRPLPNGGFAHTAVLTLVDADGAVVARSEGEQGREELTAALRRLLADRRAL